nr:hypothetical protein [Tanacetum cinerariifolium]
SSTGLFGVAAAGAAARHSHGIGCHCRLPASHFHGRGPGLRVAGGLAGHLGPCSAIRPPRALLAKNQDLVAAHSTGPARVRCAASPTGASRRASGLGASLPPPAPAYS